jgi:hypothetical protein
MTWPGAQSGSRRSHHGCNQQDQTITCLLTVGIQRRGALLEHSLPELAHMPERLPPRLWQKLVEQYQVFQIR